MKTLSQCAVKYRFYMNCNGQQIQLPPEVDSATIAMEHGQRMTEVTGQPCQVFSLTLIGEYKPVEVQP